MTVITPPSTPSTLFQRGGEGRGGGGGQGRTEGEGVNITSITGVGAGLQIPKDLLARCTGILSRLKRISGIQQPAGPEGRGLPSSPAQALPTI